MLMRWLLTVVGEHRGSYRKALSIMGLESDEHLPTLSSIHAARKKAGWAFFRQLATQVAQKASVQPHQLWLGHEVFAIDGSRLNLPHELKRQKYKGTHKGCFYPQGMLTVLVQLKTQMPHFFEFSRQTAEMKSVPRHLRHVPKDSVVVYDRLYFNKKVLAFHYCTQRFLQRKWE